jgi:hypothetical protein
MLSGYYLSVVWVLCWDAGKPLFGFFIMLFLLIDFGGVYFAFHLYIDYWLMAIWLVLIITWVTGCYGCSICVQLWVWIWICVESCLVKDFFACYGDLFGWGSLPKCLVSLDVVSWLHFLLCVAALRILVMSCSLQPDS